MYYVSSQYRNKAKRTAKPESQRIQANGEQKKTQSALE